MTCRLRFFLTSNEVSIQHVEAVLKSSCMFSTAMNFFSISLLATVFYLLHNSDAFVLDMKYFSAVS
jgi:hypothetical protein